MEDLKWCKKVTEKNDIDLTQFKIENNILCGKTKGFYDYKNFYFQYRVCRNITRI
jgi:hypothetical protein